MRSRSKWELEYENKRVGVRVMAHRGFEPDWTPEEIIEQGGNNFPNDERDEELRLKLIEAGVLKPKSPKEAA